MKDKPKGNDPLPPKKRAQRVGRLHTVGHICSEMGKLYRQARRGEINTADASRLASILALMRQGLEASELEKRLAALESGDEIQPASHKPKPVSAWVPQPERERVPA